MRVHDGIGFRTLDPEVKLHFVHTQLYRGLNRGLQFHSGDMHEIHWATRPHPELENSVLCAFGDFLTRSFRLEVLRQAGLRLPFLLSMQRPDRSQKIPRSLAGLCWQHTRACLAVLTE